MNFDNIVDPILACPQCGDVLSYSQEQYEKWGIPPCCDYKMLVIERDNIYRLIGGLNKLVENLEKELVKDF